MAGILALPWCLKPIFGFTFDHIMNKYKKTKYIIIATSLMRILIYYNLSVFKMGSLTFHLVLFLLNIVAVFENVACEYILVLSSKSANEKTGSHNSNHLPIFFGYRAVGSIIG